MIGTVHGEPVTRPRRRRPLCLLAVCPLWLDTLISITHGFNSHGPTLTATSCGCASYSPPSPPQLIICVRCDSPASSPRADPPPESPRKYSLSRWKCKPTPTTAAAADPPGREMASDSLTTPNLQQHRCTRRRNPQRHRRRDRDRSRQFPPTPTATQFIHRAPACIW